MAIINLSEQAKKQQGALKDKGLPFAVVELPTDFKNNHGKVHFNTLIYQAKVNNRWGIVYNEGKGDNTCWYFSASLEPDLSKERQEVSELLKPTIKNGLTNNLNELNQCPKTNTGNSVDFSRAYVNYLIEKLIELQYNWNVANKSGVGWGDITISKSTIDTQALNLLIEEWKTDFKADFTDDLSVDNLKTVKSKLDQFQAYSKRYEELWNYYKETLRTDLNDVPLHPDGLKEVKKTLDQLKTDKAQLEQDKQNLNTQITNLQQTINNNQGTSEQVSNLNQQLTSKDNQITNKDKIIKEQEDFILERNKTVSVLNDELRKRNQTTDEWQNAIGGLNAKNDKLTIEKNNLKIQLRDKENTNKELNGRLIEKDAELQKKDDELKTEKQKSENLDKIKTQLESEKAALEKDLEKARAENKSLTGENDSLKKEKNSLETELNSKNGRIKELEDRINLIIEAIREEIKSELTEFFQGMDISTAPIREKYESNEDWKQKYGNRFNYENIISEKLTFENRKDMKKAFKVMVCICATDSFERQNKPYENDAISRPPHLHEMLEKIVKGWEEVEAYEQIEKENNPFYLSVIEEKRQERRSKIEGWWIEIQQIQLQNLQLQSTNND